MYPNYCDVEWEEVLDRLTLVAYRLFGLLRLTADDRLLESFGDGPDDLAVDVVCGFLDPTNPHLVWNSDLYGTPTTRGVVKFLESVLRNDFRDKISAKRSKTQEPLYATDPHGEERLRFDPPDRDVSAEANLVSRSVVESFRERLQRDLAEEPDKELERYIALQFAGDTYAAYKPQEAAAALGITVQAVYLLKEKFARRLMRLFRKEVTAARDSEERVSES